MKRNYIIQKDDFISNESQESQEMNLKIDSPIKKPIGDNKEHLEIVKQEQSGTKNLGKSNSTTCDICCKSFVKNIHTC